MRMYLDYAATTPVDPRVSGAMRPYFSKIFGNPSSLHQFGQEASAAVFKARMSIAKSLGADYREIIFTGSATEANNLALRGVIKEFRIQNLGFRENKKLTASLYSKFYILKPRIVVSLIEHESILETCRDLEKDGIEVVYVPVSKEGIVDLKKMKNALNERTILVSVMHANNEVGTIQPIREISKLISEFRIQNLEFRKKNKNPKSLPDRQAGYILNPKFYPLFHTDAAQSFQYLNCNIDDLGVDMMTLSAHKIYGPKGIGMLYAKNTEFRSQNLGIKKNKNPLYSKSYILNSIITGSGQESDLRSGTENVPYIVGFAKAIEIADKLRDNESKRVARLRDYFWNFLKRRLPMIQINGSMADRLPNNLNIYFPKIKSQELLIKLDLAGIAASLGAACFSRTAQPSYVLRAMGFSLERALGSLRFSLGRQTAKRDIDYTVATLVKLLKKHESRQRQQS